MDATDSQKAHALDDYPIIKADAYIHGRPLSLSTRVCPNTEGGGVFAEPSVPDDYNGDRI